MTAPPGYTWWKLVLGDEVKRLCNLLNKVPADPARWQLSCDNPYCGVTFQWGLPFSSPLILEVSFPHVSVSGPSKLGLSSQTLKKFLSLWCVVISLSGVNRYLCNIHLPRNRRAAQLLSVRNCKQSSYWPLRPRDLHLICLQPRHSWSLETVKSKECAE